METPTPGLAKQVSQSSRRTMNSTAYRIYKLLQWLIETPLSVQTLNARFCEDPLIGKPLSTDSIWLYVNTLKTLGCEIRRPSPRNGFCYELLSHPFSLQLTEQHIEVLSQAKAYAQQHFNHQEALVLDRLLKKIVTQGQPQQAKESVDHLFAKSRSYDYADCKIRIQQVEEAIERGTLLEIVYASPMRGQETLIFLPEGIFYDQGVVYVRGERTQQPEPSNLRLERILVVSTIQDEATRQTLLQKRTDKIRVHLRLEEAPESFEGFGLAENQGVYEEKIEREKARCDVYLLIRESFYLKQRLLACEYPFQVLEPAILREDLYQTVEAMWRIYKKEQ